MTADVEDAVHRDEAAPDALAEDVKAPDRVGPVASGESDEAAERVGKVQDDQGVDDVQSHEDPVELVVPDEQVDRVAVQRLGEEEYVEPQHGAEQEVHGQVDDDDQLDGEVGAQGEGKTLGQRQGHECRRDVVVAVDEELER